MTLFDLVFDNIKSNKPVTGQWARQFIEKGCVVVDDEVCRQWKRELTGNETVTIGLRTIQIGEN